MATAAHTSELPITVPTMMKKNTHRISADRHDRPPLPSRPDDVVIVTVTSPDVKFVAMTTVALTTTMLQAVFTHKNHIAFSKLF